uniref:Uncharacterized protein n=1 Tax=Glossina pallidipes TaxID=7398 RepID=A0A1B0AI97_GLOPL
MHIKRVFSYNIKNASKPLLIAVLDCINSKPIYVLKRKLSTVLFHILINPELPHDQVVKTLNYEVGICLFNRQRDRPYFHYDCFDRGCGERITHEFERLSVKEILKKVEKAKWMEEMQKKSQAFALVKASSSTYPQLQNFKQ